MSTIEPRDSAAPQPPQVAPARTAPIVKRAHADTHDVYHSDEERALAPFKEECDRLYRDLRFDEGIALAMRQPEWSRDADAVLYVGIGMHYKRRYDEARARYRQAAALSASESLRGTCLANAGSAHFEEGDFEAALRAYDEALSVDPRNEFALLGRLAVACQRYDREAVCEAAALLRERWPAWTSRAAITTMLRRDRSLRFAREDDGLFERAFGVTLESITLL